MTGPRTGSCTRFTEAITGYLASVKSKLKAYFSPPFSKPTAYVIAILGSAPSAGLTAFTTQRAVNYLLRNDERDLGPYTLAAMSVSLFSNVWIRAIAKGPATFNRLTDTEPTKKHSDDHLAKMSLRDFKTWKSKSGYSTVILAGWSSWLFMSFNSYLGMLEFFITINGMIKHYETPEKEIDADLESIFKVLSVFTVVIGTMIANWAYNLKRSNISAAQFGLWLENDTKKLDKSWIGAIVTAAPNLAGQFVLANFTTFKAFQATDFIQKLPKNVLRAFSWGSSVSAVVNASGRDIKYIHDLKKEAHCNEDEDDTPTPCSWRALTGATYFVGALGSLCAGISVLRSFDYTLQDWGTEEYDPIVMGFAILCAVSATLADFAYNVYNGYKDECFRHAKFHRANSENYETLTDVEAATNPPPVEAQHRNGGHSHEVHMNGTNRNQNAGRIHPQTPPSVDTKPLLQEAKQATSLAQYKTFAASDEYAANSQRFFQTIRTSSGTASPRPGTRTPTLHDVELTDSPKASRSNSLAQLR